MSLLAKPNNLIKTLFQKPRDFIICHNPNNSNRSMKQILKDKILFVLLTLINEVMEFLWDLCYKLCFQHPTIYLSASHNVSTLLTSFLCWFCFLLSQTSGLSFELLAVLQLRDSSCISALTLTMYSFHSVSSQTLHLVHFCISSEFACFLQVAFISSPYSLFLQSFDSSTSISTLTISKSCHFYTFMDLSDIPTKMEHLYTH